jgi:hypothetical protein
MIRLSMLLALLLGVFWSGPALAEPNPDADAARTRLAVQRRDAARATYEAMWANYREGRVPEELPYRWSRRWLEAERQLSKPPADQVAAFRGHWERMKDLENIVRKLQRSRVSTIDQVSAVEFYRTEAELWLLQATQEAKSH